MRKRLLSLILTLAMVASLFTGMTPAAAAEPAASNREELTTTTSKTLEDGKTYYITSDVTINEDKAHQSKNGLVIEADTTVTLEIPDGLTLTVYGKNANSTNGGGAAILLPKGATLIVVGGGTLAVYGGNAANGSSGSRGGNSAAQDNKLEGNEVNNSYNGYYYYAGTGGTGGNGGGGGGAGIGTNGGTGGSDRGAGGSFWGWTIHDVEDDDGPQHGTEYGNPGANGAAGGSAAEMGTLYVSSEITITGQGGSAGSNTASGGSRGNSHYEFDDGHERGVAGSAGGGAGGAGWGGALVGTGGGGGGQGGGGGNSGYLCRYFYIGGGGGAGGWGADNTHGKDGGHGDYGKFGSESLADDEKGAYWNSPTLKGSGTDRYYLGTYGYKNGSQSAQGGSGGKGGASGNAATTYTANDANGKYILLLDWPGSGGSGDGDFGFTEGGQTLKFNLNTTLWSDAFSQEDGEDSFYYVLLDENGKPVKDANGNEIRGKLTVDPLDPNGEVSIPLPQGLPVGKYTLNVGSDKSAQGELPIGGFEIEQKPLTDTEVGVNLDVDNEDITVKPPVYNGSAFEPEVSLNYAGKGLVKGVDYDVSYGENTDAGEASVTITFKGNYSGSITKTFTIEKCTPNLSIAEGQSAVYDRASVDNADVQYTYNGNGAITVTWYADNNGEKGSVISAPTNAGTYWVGISAAEAKNYKAVTDTEKFVITPYALQNGDVSIAPNTFIYNTAAQGPIVTVKHGETTLVQGTDYAVGNATQGINVNTYTVTITGIGNYSGSFAKTWDITKANPVWFESPTASAIIYGQTLAESVFSGGTMKLGDTVVSGTFAWEAPTTAPVVADSNATAYTVIFTPEDTANYNPISSTVTLTVNKADQAAPDAVTKVDESIMDKDDGAIAGLSAEMEYRYNGGAWTDVGGTSLENLPAGTYEIRYKETANHNPGAVTEVIIAEGRYLTVSFETADGSEIAAMDTVHYNSTISEPVPPTKPNFNFAGWFKDEDCKQTWNFAQDTVTIDITLYAKWSQLPVYSVGGNAQTGGAPLEGATVEIKRGNEVISATVTDSNGNYTLNNIPDGDYNIVITKDGKEFTKLVTVKDGVISETSMDMPSAAVSSSVVVVEDSDVEHKMTGIEGTLVDGLDAIASAQTPGTGEFVTIQMVVTPKEDVTGEDSHEDKDSQLAIKQKAMGRQLEFFDLTLTKIVTASGAASASTDIGDSNTQILKIVVPFKTAGTVSVVVYRYHDGAAEAMQKNPAAGEEGYVVGSNCVIIYAKNFSTYAIGYSMPIYVTSYSIAVSDVENGTVTTDFAKASQGKTVTISVTPDDGYQLSQLTVTDKDGQKIAVTQTSDGTYTFKMPDSNVTVEAEFVPEAGSTACPKDETCPIHHFTDTDKQAWYHDGVHYCLENDLMIGIGDDQFAPNGMTTRAQLVTMLWRMEGEPLVEVAESFNDVSDSAWYNNAVRWASSTGIAEGYGDSIFAPNDIVTREQMVTILWRYAKYKGVDVSVGEDTNLLSYEDASDVSTWAMGAMQWAFGSGLIQGIEKDDSMYLDPQGSAVRSQSATMIYRFCTEIMK